MRLRLILACLALLPGLGLAELAPGNHSYYVFHGGALRYFQVYVPATSPPTPPSRPLVLDFHGYTSDYSQQASISGWRAVADREGIMVAWPQGSGTIPSWNAETCCGLAQLLGIDDVGFARTIVNTVASLTPLDRNRVYASGLSNGGAMSHLLGCEAADVFAAVAPVSFPLPTYFTGGCVPSRPVSVIHFHGYQDTVVPYWTGIAPTFRSAPASFRAWRDVNQCSDNASTSLRKGFSSCKRHDQCAGDSEVELCSVQGGHVLYSNWSSLAIADVAWNFFARHPLN